MDGMRTRTFIIPHRVKPIFGSSLKCVPPPAPRHPPPLYTERNEQATRSASAYLVLSLCERAPMEIHRAAPRLLPTLTNTALSERSSTLRRTYSSALSSVARLAPAAGVSRLASRLAQLFREADPDFDKRQRRTLSLLLGDLCRRAGGQLGAPGTGAGAGGRGGGGGSDGGAGFASSGWARILPVAFVARSDPDKPVAQAFEEAWQEGLTQLQLGAAGQGEACRVRNAKDAVMLMVSLPCVFLVVSVSCLPCALTGRRCLLEQQSQF